MELLLPLVVPALIALALLVLAARLLLRLLPGGPVTRVLAVLLWRRHRARRAARSPGVRTP